MDDIFTGQFSLFDDEIIKSTDWEWSMAKDYPKKNGLKVFSCFACGGGEYYGIQISRL